jgi:hypothetical protein
VYQTVRRLELLRRGMSRRSLAVVALLWLATVYLWWREFVPLRAMLLPTPPSGRYWRGFTDDRQMILFTPFPTNEHGPQSLLDRDPLEIWDPVRQVVTRTLFDSS